MNNKHIISSISLCLLLAMVMLTACNTDVELCYADEHPHRTAVKYEYNWSGKSNDVIPDSMYVIAYRVVNQWKASMVVNSKDYRGHFVYNGPELPVEEKETDASTPSDTQTSQDGGTTGDDKQNGASDDDKEQQGNSGASGNETPEAGAEPVLEQPLRAAMTRAEGGEDATEGAAGDTDVFQIRTGSYKFITFSMNSSELVYDDVIEYMLDENNEKSLQDIYVKYKVYDKTDDKLKRLTADWQDYNPYAQYMWNDVKPVMFDTIASKEVPTNTTVTCKFTPKSVTQRIDVYFSIQKKIKPTPFRIDSVLCEMGGIPRRINIANGYLDISETAKVMFRTDDMKDTDTAKGPVKVHGQINVPGVVQSNSPSLITGPGIMQVLIFASVEDPDGGKVDDGNGNMVTKRLQKKIQAKINLYNTLHTSNLITRTDDGKHAVRNGDKGVINVVTDIVVVNGEDVLKDNDATGGIDQWIDCSEDIIIHI